MDEMNELALEAAVRVINSEYSTEIKLARLHLITHERESLLSKYNRTMNTLGDIRANQ